MKPVCNFEAHLVSAQALLGPSLRKADFVPGSDEAEARYLALTSTLSDDAHELAATSMSPRQVRRESVPDIQDPSE